MLSSSGGNRQCSTENSAAPTRVPGPSTSSRFRDGSFSADEDAQSAKPFNRQEHRIKVQEMIVAKGYNPGPKAFNCNPPNARYFVIKSYTEDDVHKSLKYGIWASTEIGNRRLNQAYLESHTSGPVYLFYSVNASGHFCGIAEMQTGVDWDTSSQVWAQEGKWKGTFEVRWIFVKDIPNAVLRHLRVVNNENKPVTNSRDTQELMPDVGREMLRIFSEFKSRTCILDDWVWYDQREEEEHMRKQGGGNGKGGYTSSSGIVSGSASGAEDDGE
ncbi:YT521-B-like domain-containing protein [Cladochytrium replicatum]|nr:YT521-B-like domain-containing protein [Cladochytrium replicatum]